MIPPAESLDGGAQVRSIFAFSPSIQYLLGAESQTPRVDLDRFKKECQMSVGQLILRDKKL